MTRWGTRPLFCRRLSANLCWREREHEGYPELHDRIKGILDSDDRIPFVEKIGDWYYNFWQDASHERGIGL